MAPTIKATLIATIDGIASAQADLSEEERKLQARRARLDRSMREALTALADLEAAATAAQAGDQGPPFVPALPGTARGTDQARLQVGPRRRYMAAAIKTCREIILAFGRPATMAEIHAAHPERERLPILALYKALEQRTRYARPSFLTKNGVFWVPDKPLPEGWVHPKGTPWTVVPMHYRFRGSKAPASANAAPGSKGYPKQATYLTPEEQAEFEVGSAHELVALLNGAWSAQGRRALALGSFPTSRRKLEFVLTEARKARAGGIPPVAPTE